MGRDCIRKAMRFKTVTTMANEYFYLCLLNLSECLAIIKMLFLRRIFLDLLRFYHLFSLIFKLRSLTFTPAYVHTIPSLIHIAYAQNQQSKCCQFSSLLSILNEHNRSNTERHVDSHQDRRCSRLYSEINRHCIGIDGGTR